MSAMPKLDTEKFRKVLRLINEGATDGERKAAKARAEVMAQRAGMSFKQAVSNLDTQREVEQPAPFNIFEEFFNSPEMRAKRTAKEIELAARRKQLLEEYGSESAIFARTDREWLLFNAVKGFSRVEEWKDDDGTVHPYAVDIDGPRPFYHGLEDLTPRTVRAVSEAYPLPTTVHSAMAEYHYWDRLRQIRIPFSGGDWQHYCEVEARIAILRDILDNQPSASWEDMDARMEWWEDALYYGGTSNEELERQRKDRIQADLAILRNMSVQNEPKFRPVQNGRMTNADKANAVKKLLHDFPALSDREISRRAGVSPQTVSNWRARLGLRKGAA